MLNAKLIAAAVAGLTLAACASDPVYYSDRGYDRGYTTSTVTGDPYRADYGRVVAIDVVRGRGGATGAGAVVGGIVGGVLGHQVGSGRGNDLATAAGAVGGAVAGHQIEKNRSGDEDYRITVQLPDGREATFIQDSLYGIRVGDRVRIEGDRVVRD